MRPLFPTVSPSNRCLCPQRLLILHSLRSPRAKSEILAPLFSITCALFFTLCKRTTRHLASFQSLPPSLHECQGSLPSSPKYADQSASARRAARCSTERTNRPSQRTGSGRCPLFAMFLFRHIVTSSLHPEKPYAAPHHLMAKRYRTLEEVYTSSCREAKSCNPLLQSF